MAWRVKPSATMQIPTRREPYVTSDLQERWRRDILPRYETPLGALIPILHEVQHEHGYVPYQAMIEVAAFLGIQPADVMDTVTFYEEFHTEAVGKHVIGVCQSIACEVCGHQAVLDHLRQKLDLEPRETTDDGRFTLLTMECLGACDFAPVCLINGKLHTNLTIEKIDDLLDQLPE